MPSAGTQRATSSPPASSVDSQRALEHPGDDRAPHPRLALGLVAALGDVGHAALLQPVLLTQERQHRGQEGQRPQHRDGDDQHRADAEADEDRVAGEQQPGHRGHHRDARDQHGTARRAGGDLHRRLDRMAAVALLHHPPRIEHRVVHADRQTDDHHELGHVDRERVELADRPQEPDRARHGGRAEHEREARRDERTERDQQDDQQQAVGDELRLLARPWRPEPRSPWRLRRRRTARRAHRDGRLDGGHCGERLVDELLDVLVRAGDLEVHDDGAAVLRDRVDARGGIERALDRGDALDPLQAGHDISHRRRHLGIAGLDRSPCPAPAPAHRPARGSRPPRRSCRRAWTRRCPAQSRRASFWPTLPPSTAARTTNAIQPRMAVLRCCALHRPARAARFRDCMWAPSSAFVRCTMQPSRTLYDSERGVNRTTDEQTRTSHRAASAAEQGARPARRRGARRARRDRVADDAQARRRARRGRDVPLPPRPQQGAAARRDGRHRLQRDRAAADRRRLEDGHADAGALDPRGPRAAPLGDRPDGGADEPRAREPQPPQRGARMSPRGRLLARDDRARVLRPRRLHLRVRAAAAGHVVRERGRLRGGGAAADARIRGRAGRVPAPRRGGRGVRRRGGLRLRHGVRVRARPDPRRPRPAPDA